MANRVASITEATNAVQWRYVSSKSNPADQTSRDLSVDNFLACKRWIEGPDILRKPEVDWPQPVAPQPIMKEDPEVKRNLRANAITSGSEDATTKLIHHFSWWTKLKTSVAWFLRLKTILLSQREKGRR